MKKLKLITIIAVIFLISSTPVFANTSDFNTTENEAVTLEEAAPSRIDGHYEWKVAEINRLSDTYGAWRDGPSGYGAGTLTLTDDSSTGTTVTNTISGTYTSLATISAALGVSINHIKSYPVSYSHYVPSGQHHEIIYRPRFAVYQVIEKYYYVDHGTEAPTGETKTCYVHAYLSWDYGWRTL